MANDDSDVDVDDLLQGLRDTSWLQRVDTLQSATARFASGTVGAEVEALLIPSIIHATEDEKWEVRKAAALTLGEIRHHVRGIVEPALTLLRADPNRWVSHAATRAIQRIQARSRKATDDWALTGDEPDPILQYIAKRIQTIGRRSLTPASIYELSMEVGEQVYLQFAADMAHEVRTMLTPLEGYIVGIGQALGGRETGDNMVEGHVVSSLAVMRQLRAMIEDLQTYSFQSRGVFTPVCLDAIVNSALASGVERAGVASNPALVAQDVDVSSQLVLEALPGRLVRAFSNIIANAYQAMPAGGKLIARGTSSGADFVELTIIDTGHGMSPEVVALAFKRFCTTRRDAGGTGLGLPIAQRIIEHDHAGSLSLSSNLGEGTTVVVQLPTRHERRKD